MHLIGFFEEALENCLLVKLPVTVNNFEICWIKIRIFKKVSLHHQGDNLLITRYILQRTFLNMVDIDIS